jgi:hypothetical protein
MGGSHAWTGVFLLYAVLQLPARAVRGKAKWVMSQAERTAPLRVAKETLRKAGICDF